MPSIVHLDTNVLRRDLTLSGVEASLLRALIRTGVPIRISKVAAEEAPTLAQEHAMKASQQIEQGSRTLRDLGVDAAAMPQRLDRGDVAVRVAAGFEERLKGLGVEVLAIPQGLTHDKVLARLQAGRQPFSGVPGNRDRGYRDFLIWATFLDDAETSAPARAVFVTNDAKDFLHNDRLHPDLRRDVEDRALEVTVYPSPAAFIAEFVRPRLKASARVRALLDTDQLETLSDWLEREVRLKAAGTRAFTSDLYWEVDFPVEDEVLLSVFDLDEIKLISSVTDLGDDEALIVMTVGVSALIEYGVQGGDLLARGEESAIAEYGLDEVLIPLPRVPYHEWENADEEPLASRYFRGVLETDVELEVEMTVRVSNDERIEPFALRVR